MIIGKRNLKLLKLCIVSPKLEKIVIISYLALIPILVMSTFFAEIQSGSTTIDQQTLSKYFQFDQFLSSNSTDKINDYLNDIFIPRYFSEELYIPTQKILILQQRTSDTFSPNYSCDDSCQYRQIGTNSTRLQIDGLYNHYTSLGYYFIIQQEQLIKIKDWIDEDTEALVILCSVYDIQAKKQIQLTFISEYPTQFLNQQVKTYQIRFFNFKSNVHSLLFFYFSFVVLILTFRILLELSYIFSRFMLLAWLLNFLALYTYIFVHLYQMVKVLQPSNINLLTPNTEYVDCYDAYQIQELKNYENLSLLVIWLIYPFRFMHFQSQLFVNEWIQIYQNAIYKSFNAFYYIAFFFFFLYLNTYAPQLILFFQNSLQQCQFTLQFFITFFYEGEKSQPYDYVIPFFGTISFYIFIIYVAAIMLESFRRALILQSEPSTTYESELSETIDTINIKINKFLKELFKIYQKKKTEKKVSIIDNDLIEQDFLSEIDERAKEKILIVYEIQNQYLEEINRYKAKKESQYQYLKNIKKTQNQNFGSIIGGLLQRNAQKANNKLKKMLSKYCKKNLIFLFKKRKWKPKRIRTYK